MIGEGLRVVELGSGSIAAAVTGMHLADNGARVVKVEPPDGDALRRTLPSGADVWDRGKESLVANLRTAGGRGEVAGWCARADVVIEAFAPGVAEGFGLGHGALASVNRGLVYCSITGFGPTGPYSRIPGYEAIVQAKAGVWGRGAWAFRPGPIFCSVPLASQGAAHLALGGIMSALVARARTGRGQLVETSLVQGLNALDNWGLMHRQHMRRTGGELVMSPNTGAMAATRYFLMACTKDGRIVLFGTMQSNEAHATLRAVGLGEMLDDPRYAAAPRFASARDAQDCEDAVWAALRTRTLEEWLPILRAHTDVAFEAAISAEEALDHPQLQHLGTVVEVHHATLGPMRQVGPLATFGRTPSTIRRPAPSLGTHGPPFEDPAAGVDPPVTQKDGADAGPTLHPLSGVTIVECGSYFAMPFGVTLAAAMGARVVKVEPLTGDPMRSSFGVEVGGVKTLEAKESVAVDLRTPEGREVVHRLVARADAFVHNFRPGVAERLGLDYATLSALNPRLVHVHAAGYGADGPYSARPMYAMTASAGAGGYGRHAAYWLDPSLLSELEAPELQAVVAPRLRPPVDGDSNAALAVFSALVLAIAHQQLTGEGQSVTTSMLTGNAHAYSDDVCSWEGKVPVPVSDSEQYGFHALYRMYRARAGWVCLVVAGDRDWHRLCAVEEFAHLGDDGRFADALSRRDNDGDLTEAIATVFLSGDAPDWERTLGARNVACVEVLDDVLSAFTLDDPVMAETRMSIEVDHPMFGRIVRHGLPVHFSETPGRIAPSPMCGQDTEAILGELGYDAAGIHALVERSIVGLAATVEPG